MSVYFYMHTLAVKLHNYSSEIIFIINKTCNHFLTRFYCTIILCQFFSLAGGSLDLFYGLPSSVILLAHAYFFNVIFSFKYHKKRS